MNDEFLYRLCRPPRPEFAEGLYRRLSANSWPIRLFRFSVPVAKGIAWSLAVLGLVCSAALLASPDARAVAQQLLSSLRGDRATVVEFDHFPVSGDEQSQDAEVPQGMSMVVGDPALMENVDGASPMPGQAVSLAEARDLLPFALDLPAWAPQGLVMHDLVTVTLPHDYPNLPYYHASVCWTRPEDGGEVYLEATYVTESSDEGVQWLVGMESAEEIEIGGQTAVLIRGGWQGGSGEFGGDMVVLAWQRDGVSYALVKIGGQITAEDLIRMAGSMR